jgi:cysteine desulfuration protein SufE
MRIAEIEDEIIEEFELFGDNGEGKYEHLIDLGNHVPLIDKQHRTDDRLIKGCQSRVWLHSELYNEKVVFTADSDAIITKGIVVILIRVFSGQTPGEIMKVDLKFIDDIGLKEHLSPTRANGLVSMIKQIKMYAIALNLSQNS